MESTTIKVYFSAYQESYDDIASQLTNKNRYKDQIKYYKVFLQKKNTLNLNYK